MNKLTLWPTGRCDNITSVFFKFNLQLDVLRSACEIWLRGVPDKSDDESALVQVIILVRSGIKLDLWRHVLSLGHNRSINASPPGQNGRHSADDILKRIFLN